MAGSQQPRTQATCTSSKFDMISSFDEYKGLRNSTKVTNLHWFWQTVQIFMSSIVWESKLYWLTALRGVELRWNHVKITTFCLISHFKSNVSSTKHFFIQILRFWQFAKTIRYKNLILESGTRFSWPKLTQNGQKLNFFVILTIGSGSSALVLPKIDIFCFLRQPWSKYIGVFAVFKEFSSHYK